MLHLAVKVYKASKNSWAGLKCAYQSEWAFRLELVILVLAIPLAFLVSHNLIERILMICSVLLIPMVELMNTAVEAAIDRISLEYHELSAKAKDTASAATLFAIINAIIIWGMILFSKLFDHLI